MLALLDSLLRDRADDEAEFDPEDQGKRFLAWADDGAYTPDGDGRFDIGNATSSALARLRRGTPAEQAGGTGERDLGNGSLMRILPIALVDRDELGRDAHRAGVPGIGRHARARGRPGHLRPVRADRAQPAARASRESAFLRARGVLDVRLCRRPAPGLRADRGVEGSIRSRVRGGLVLVGVGRVRRSQGLPRRDRARDPVRRGHRHDGRDRRRPGRDPVRTIGHPGPLAREDARRGDRRSAGRAPHRCARHARPRARPARRRSGPSPLRPAHAPPRPIRSVSTGWTRRRSRPAPAGPGAWA